MDILLPAPEVVVASFVLAPGHTTTRKLPQAHRRLTIDAQELDWSRNQFLYKFNLHLRFGHEGITAEDGDRNNFGARL